MKWLDMFLRRGNEDKPVIKAPPPPGRDPDLVDHAIRTARVLSKADSAIERRHRLNLELNRAEDAIRSAGARHQPGARP